MPIDNSLPDHRQSHFATVREIAYEFGIDEMQLWQFVVHNLIEAYVYVSRNFDLQYSDKPLIGDRFYPLHREEIKQFKNQFDLNFRPDHITKIWRFQGMQSKLTQPMIASRDEIRFCTDEVRACIVSSSYRHPKKKYIYKHHSDVVELGLATRRPNVQRARDPDRASTSLEKILALLVYRYALIDESCISPSGKINSSRLQTLLLRDAEKLGKNDEGIAACRKQIGEALKVHELSVIKESSR